ncbi:hypothetical protein H0H87_011598, partial [Tephrocybe sp. NHM501043]
MDISNDIFGRLKESDNKNGTTYETDARDYFMKFEHDEFVGMDGTTDVSFELPDGYPLWYLHKAGYVHRDVSAGNCLWGIASEKGKLSDLEYARPYDELSIHDPLT